MFLSLDGGEPALGLVDLINRIGSGIPGHMAMGAGADADVIAAAPNLQVMAAFLSGPGVIGNFIGRHPGHREALLAHFVHFRPGVLIGGGDGVAVKGRARLDGELIHR